MSDHDLAVITIAAILVGAALLLAARDRRREVPPSYLTMGVSRDRLRGRRGWTHRNRRGF